MHNSWLTYIIIVLVFVLCTDINYNKPNESFLHTIPFEGSNWSKFELKLSNFELDSSKLILQSIKPANQDELNYLTYRKNEIAKWEADLTGPVLDSIIELDSISPLFQQLLFSLNKHLVYKFMDPLQLEHIVNELQKDSTISIYWIAKGYQAIGDIYHLQYNDINQSKKWYESALSIYQSLPFEVPELLFLYQDMIQISVATREYQLGQLYGLKMINIATDKFKDNPALEAMAYYLSGYMDLISGDSSTVKFNHALSLVVNSGLNRLIQQIALYSNYSYRFSNQIELAQPFLEILSRNVAKYGDYIDYEKVVGEKYYVEENYTMAITHLQNALKFSSSHPSLYPGHRLSILYSLILSNTQLQQYDKALDYAFMSLSGNKELDLALSRKAILDTILSGAFDHYSYSFMDAILVAKILLLSSQQSKSLQELYLALRLSKKAFSLVENEEYSIEEFRRLEFTRYAKEVFETGMHVCAELYSQTGQDSILNDYFLFASNNKYRILTSESSKLYKQYNIPENISSQERDYKAKYNKYKRLQKKDSLYYYKIQIDRLNALYQAGFSEFFNSRLSLSRLRLDDLRIPSKTSFLDYQLFDSTLYLLRLSNSVKHLYRHRLTKLDYELLDHIINDQRNPSPNLDTLWKLACSGSELLLPEINEYKDYTLVISPCNIISRISFVALTLSESPDYLNDHYHIYYMNKIHPIDVLPASSSPSPDQKIVAFSFSDKNTIKSSNLSIELPGSYLEVQELKNTYSNTTIYSGLQATKDNFFKTLEDTTVDVLHVAMHAFADPDGNIEPYILFRNPKNVSELDTLFSYELINHTTSAKYLFLSSCYSREGKYIAGEGVYDLTRLYFKLGIRQIVAQLWEAPDLIFQHSHEIAPYFWAGQIKVYSYLDFDQIEQ